MDTTIKLKIYLLTMVVIFSFTHPVVAENDLRIPKKFEDRTAILYLESTSKIIGPNFSFKIMVDPGEQAINVVGVKINFSKNKLQIEELNIQNSFCELFVDNNFDNITGQINISCGKPYPGVNNISEIGIINFVPVENGFASINFSEDSVVLANDGFGTNILESTNSKSLYLNNYLTTSSPALIQPDNSPSNL